MGRYDVLAVSPGTANIAEVVRRAAEVLASHGVLGHPTDSVYGLGGAIHPAVDRCVAELKRRPLEQFPLIRIAGSADVFRRSLPDLVWTAHAERLADRFWPGALTMVLADGSGGGSAIRVEAHPVIRAVLDVWNAPISSTSLNVSGEPPATTGEQAAACLDVMPDVAVPVLLLDAGRLPGPPPSTLVSLLDATRPTVLREGAVSREALERCLGSVMA